MPCIYSLFICMWSLLMHASKAPLPRVHSPEDVIRTIFRSFYRMYHHVCRLGAYLGDRTPLWDMSHRTVNHIQLWPLWGYTHLHSWFLWEDPESWIGLTVRRGREEHAVSVLTGQCWLWASATWTTRTLRYTAWRVFTSLLQGVVPS